MKAPLCFLLLAGIQMCFGIPTFGLDGNAAAGIAAQAAGKIGVGKDIASKVGGGADDCDGSSSVSDGPSVPDLTTAPGSPIGPVSPTSPIGPGVPGAPTGSVLAANPYTEPIVAAKDVGVEQGIETTRAASHGDIDNASQHALLAGDLEVGEASREANNIVPGTGTAVDTAYQAPSVTAHLAAKGVSETANTVDGGITTGGFC